MKNTIIFYAPLGKNTPFDKNGGAEAGCIKTKKILSNLNYNILVVDKPIKKDGIYAYGFSLIKAYIKLLSLLKKYPHGILHISGNYRGLIYWEWILLRTAKILKHKIVYEIRNGGMIEEYYKQNFIYKYFMKNVLIKSDEVLCQGSAYVKFIKTKWKKNTIYYPNYIMNKYVKDYSPRTCTNKINIIYTGRLVKSKNIDIILKCCKILSDRKISYTLELIGGYDNNYKKQLDSLIYSLELNPNNIIFWNRKEFDFISERLYSSHFFIFPTENKREGHSNSLTEAMGCGVVPLVSDIGFNKEIVNDHKLVIPKIDPILYAKAIEEIWSNGTWIDYSLRVYKRTKKEFTESRAKSILKFTYERLFS